MPQGMSKEERAAATARLQGKLDALKTDIVNQKLEQTPTRNLIDKHLTQRELEAVRKMLERKRGKAPTEVGEAWGALKELGNVKMSEKKFETL